MSRDSWKNNRIIIVTVVFPNIWQLWVVSVIVMAGRERCGVFFLLNKGRGPRNVSQSFRNALLLRNRMFLDDSHSSLTSKFMSFYPANNCEKKNSNTQNRQIGNSHFSDSQSDLPEGSFDLHRPSLSTAHIKNSCDQSLTIIREMCFSHEDIFTSV